MKTDHIDMMLEIGQIGGEDIFIHNDKYPHGPEFTAKVIYIYFILYII